MRYTPPPTKTFFARNDKERYRYNMATARSKGPSPDNPEQNPNFNPNKVPKSLKGEKREYLDLLMEYHYVPPTAIGHKIMERHLYVKFIKNCTPHQIASGLSYLRMEIGNSDMGIHQKGLQKEDHNSNTSPKEAPLDPSMVITLLDIIYPPTKEQ